MPQKEMLECDGDAEHANESVALNHAKPTEEEIESWEPKPPKVLMDDPNAIPLELRSQIQLYATNEYVELAVAQIYLIIKTNM